MADLKAGTTVGGSIAWHQGNFPLTPVSNDVYYKTYKIYTEYNKPLAIDNDFVSKADGGVYLNKVTFNNGLSFLDKTGFEIRIDKNTRTEAMYDYSALIRLNDSLALENAAGQPFIIFNPSADPLASRLTVMGLISGREVRDSSGRVFSPGNPPTPTDVSLGNVTNDKQVKLLETQQQTMSGVLAAPNFISTNPASQAAQVPRFDQVVVKDSIQDFGYYS